MPPPPRYWALFKPHFRPSPLPRRARAAPPACLTRLCCMMTTLHVCRSCGCPRAAAGPHSISKHRGACALQFCRAGHRQPMTCDGAGPPTLRLFIGSSSLIRSVLPQLRVPQSCCRAAQQLERSRCLHFQTLPAMRRQPMTCDGAGAPALRRWR
jgi:hypothetical protein